MNANQILKQVFPQATAYRTHEMQGHCNGLLENTMPQNCQIIDQFEDKNYEDRRTHFLLDIDGQLVHLRICAAGKGNDYAEYAAILTCTTNNETVNQFDTMKKSFTGAS